MEFFRELQKMQRDLNAVTNKRVNNFKARMHASVRHARQARSLNTWAETVRKAAQTRRIMRLREQAHKMLAHLESIQHAPTRNDIGWAVHYAGRRLPVMQTVRSRGIRVAKRLITLFFSETQARLKQLLKKRKPLAAQDAAAAETIRQNAFLVAHDVAGFAKSRGMADSIVGHLHSIQDAAAAVRAAVAGGGR